MIIVSLPLPRNGHYQMQWDYVLSNFKPDMLYVIGDESNAPTTNVFSALEAEYILDGSGLPLDHKLVLLAADNGRYIQGDEDLLTFVHPTDAIYLFGHDTEWVDDFVLGGRIPDHKVFVDTDTIDDMWSWVTYGVVAWDRRLKNG